MKTALVIGCSAEVESEVEAALELFKPDFTIGVNDYGATHDTDYIASLHLGMLLDWRESRAAAGIKPAKALFTSIYPPILSHYDMTDVVRLDSWGGSSGLLAVQAALSLGADKIILAGCPIDQDSGRMTQETHLWPDGNAYRAHWLEHRDEIKDKVRSMSGWTAEEFGRPDGRFLGKAFKKPEKTQPEPKAEAGGE